MEDKTPPRFDRAAEMDVGPFAHPRDIDPHTNAAYLGLDAPATPHVFGLVCACETVEAYAHALFDFFRRCDTAGINTIYCQTVEPVGLGRALMDRLRRAGSA